MKITNKSFWLSVYGFSIVVSFLVVAVLGSEIYYRDRYYREVAKNDDNFYLKIFPTGFYTDLIDPQNSYTTIHLSKNSKNQRIEYCNQLILLF